MEFNLGLSRQDSYLAAQGFKVILKAADPLNMSDPLQGVTWLGAGPSEHGGPRVLASGPKTLPTKINIGEKREEGEGRSASSSLVEMGGGGVSCLA